jgi:hypothetical protein
VPDTIEIPPQGQPNAEPEEFDVAGAIESLRTAQNESETERWTQELAWAFNQYCPRIPIAGNEGAELTDGYMLDTANWEYPTFEDNPEAFPPNFPHIRWNNNGWIRAKTE